MPLLMRYCRCTHIVTRGLIALSSIALSACNATESSMPALDAANAATQLSSATPDADHFYDAPDVLPDVAGTILKFRPITYQPAGVALPNSAWQLQYVTHDGNGRPLAAVTTVIRPLVPTAYGHPVLVSFQDAYDSLGASCTPSHTATGSNANSTNTAETLEFMPTLQALGWTIVIPDYEGPHHAFGAGPLSAKATLDSIRAALNFQPLGLSQDTPVALWGYSGGAYASTWAAALHPSYAPDIHLAGVVAGGTPVDLFDVIRRKENTDTFNFLFTLVMGIAREDPALLPPALLTERGAKAVAALRDACVGVPAAGTSITAARMSDYVAADDPYSTPGFQAIMPKVTLLGSSLRPAADVFLYHETNDELVPVEGADALAAQWCAAGVPLNYYHSNYGIVTTYTPTGIHTSGAAAGTPAAIAYLAGRFANSPMPVTPPGSVRCN